MFFFHSVGNFIPTDELIVFNIFRRGRYTNQSYYIILGKISPWTVPGLKKSSFLLDPIGQTSEGKKMFFQGTLLQTKKDMKIRGCFLYTSFNMIYIQWIFPMFDGYARLAIFDYPLVHRHRRLAIFWSFRCELKAHVQNPVPYIFHSQKNDYGSYIGNYQTEWYMYTLLIYVYIYIYTCTCIYHIHAI